MVTTSSKNNVTTIILSPNRSPNWKDIKIWLLLISIPCLTVALSWFFVGVWIILLFAILELSLLSGLMYFVCYQNYRQQQITIEHNNISFTSRINKTDQEYIFHRHGCYLAVTKPIKPINNLKLALKNESKTITVGEFLGPNDRECARRTIRDAGVIECSSRWWDD